MGQCIPVVYDMKVVTTEMSCGLRGQNTSVIHTPSDYQLLYIECKTGSLVNRLDFTFHYGCQETTGIVGEHPDQ